MERNDSFWLKWFLIFFVYSIFLGLAVQLVVVPILFPQWHAGNGLIKAHDWVTYHQLAVEMAAQMRENGIRAWAFSPDHWLEPSVVAFVYYLTFSSPLVLLPLNALIHATTGVILTHLFSQFYDKKTALLGAFPFVFFPSSLLWVTQIHKDGFFFLGAALFIWGWVLIFENQKQRFPAWGVFGLVWFGLEISFIARSYLSLIYWILSIFFVLLYLSAFFRSTKNSYDWRGLAFCAVLAISLVPQKILFPSAYGVSSVVAEAPKKDATSKKSVAIETPAPPRLSYEWVSSPWLPSFVNTQLYNLAFARNGFLHTNLGNSNFDKEVAFKSSSDIVQYLPRAFQVGFFGPFPNSWFKRASNEANETFKKLVGLEMSFVYLLFPYFLLACIRNRKRLSFLALVCFSITFIWIFAMSCPNFGTLHRFRYFYLTLVTGLGLAQFCDLTGLLRGLQSRSSRLFFFLGLHSVDKSDQRFIQT